MKNLTILWLDDIRDPERYFNKKNNSSTFIKNSNYYHNLSTKYDINYVWVKNFDEFTNFIVTNGLPQFVSFDHDLGAGKKKGFDCAKWLVEYCRKNNKKLPKFYVHSANKNGQISINNLLNGIKESVIIEGKILDPRTIARDIAKAYNLPKPPSPVVIHRFAKAKGFGFKRAGGLRGYAENIKTAIAQDPDTFKRCYLSNPDYNADKFIEPDRNPRFYVPESKFSKIIREEIDELELFHGSPNI